LNGDRADGPTPPPKTPPIYGFIIPQRKNALLQGPFGEAVNKTARAKRAAAQAQKICGSKACCHYYILSRAAGQYGVTTGKIALRILDPP